MSVRLSPRLSSAAEFVRQDAVFADIGTDHAYLPIFLLESGKIRSAVASDVNAGPLESAKRNAADRALLDKMTFVRCDGAQELMGLGITDYAICGMGGELIADIIERAPWLCDGSLRLILQPMSKQGELRRSLYKNGFSVECERYTYDSGKYYVTLCVRYTGISVELDSSLAEIGLNIPDNVNKSAQIGYFEAKKCSILKKINGKTVSGNDAFEEKKILSSIEEHLALLKD